MKKTFVYVLPLCLLIVAASCSKKSMVNQTTKYSKTEIVKIAESYGWSEDAIAVQAPIKYETGEQLNEFLIATKLQSIFLHEYPQKDVATLAAGIRQALTNKVVQPSNVLETYIRNAGKNLTGKQMYLALQQSLTRIKLQDNAALPKDIEICTTCGETKYPDYYKFLLNKLN